MSTVVEDEELYPGQLAGSPFEGITLERLRLVDATLRGYVVRVAAERDDWYRDGEPSTGIFMGFALPDANRGMPLAALGDLQIATDWWDDRTACGMGLQHVLGLGAVRSFEVVSRDAWYVCERCGAWRPRAMLDWTWWGREVDGVYDDSMGYDRDGALGCVRQSREGYCR